ncbi:MAG: hypothetical protein QOD75_4036 [Blastocatellia bacterium]|nr:hypothetical protein [Blastocatellia bacterium]
MGPYQKLTIITIVTATVSAIAVATSLLWKSSTEVAGQTRKRLTPAGRLLFGIALIGLFAAVASELIRVSIRNNERLQAQAAAAQKQALLEQEARWRTEMKDMLGHAQSDIGKNLYNTIMGFQDSQNQFNHTQAEIITSKQSVLDSNLRHTNEIVLAGQPLTSLSLHWQFASPNAALWQEMSNGQDAIRENDESVQGSSPRVPYEVMEYQSALLPLVSRVANFGGHLQVKGAAEANYANETIVVLIPLDESQNAILSFGYIANETSWYKDQGEPPLSAGFPTRLDPGARDGNSTPRVSTNLAAKPDRGMSNYAINWTLDSATLWNAIDRKNTEVRPTAKLPTILKVAIFYDVSVLPFQKNNFGLPYADLWGHNTAINREVAIGQDLKNSAITIEVNGFRETRYSYVLKKMYKLRVIDEYDDDIDTNCTVLEFEAA